MSNKMPQIQTTHTISFVEDEKLVLSLHNCATQPHVPENNEYVNLKNVWYIVQHHHSEYRFYADGPENQVHITVFVKESRVQS